MQDRLKTNCGRKKTIQVPRNVGIIAQKNAADPNSEHKKTPSRDRIETIKMLRKTLKMKAYRWPLVQALLPGDIDKRVKWAEDYLEAAERDFTYPDYILWTDEAIFHLDGHVNRHNAVIWSVQNPYALMECSNQKKAGVMVWAGLIKDRIIGPFFINGSVTGQVYLQLLQQRVWPALQAIMGKRKNLLFSTMMEPQFIMKPVLEPGWMESWRTDGWAEGDPYHGQHEVLIYLHWTSGFGVT